MEAAKLLLAGLAHVDSSIICVGVDVSGSDLSDALKDLVSANNIQFTTITFASGDAEVELASLERAYYFQANGYRCSAQTYRTCGADGMTKLSLPKLTAVDNQIHVKMMSAMTHLSIPKLRVAANPHITHLSNLVELDLTSLAVTGDKLQGASFMNLDSLPASGLKISEGFILARLNVKWTGIPNVDCSNNAGLKAMFEACKSSRSPDTWNVCSKISPVPTGC